KYIFFLCFFVEVFIFFLRFFFIFRAQKESYFNPPLTAEQRLLFQFVCLGGGLQARVPPQGNVLHFFLGGGPKSGDMNEKRPHGRGDWVLGGGHKT
ncbi:hypothetical protein ACVGXB_00035, partial [Enterobacter intestinihominis]